MTSGRAVLISATACALALAIRSLVVHPVPLWVGALALIAYLGVIGVGALMPRAQMFANIVYHGPEGTCGVALTFDDGPHPEHTRSVLRLLDEYGARATFFVIGEKAERYPDLIAEIATRGHSIGVHGYQHDRLLALRSASRVRADLRRALNVVEAATGVRPWLFRPPVGQTNPTIARVSDELGLTIIGWSVRARDGIPASPPAVAERVIRGLENGAIVLLHDAAERDDRIPAAPAALESILIEMRRRGLTGVPVDVCMSGHTPDPIISEPPSR